MMLKRSLKEEQYAQTSAELLLIFAGIMVIVIIMIYAYLQYINSLGGDLNTSTSEIQDQLNNISKTLQS